MKQALSERDLSDLDDLMPHILACARCGADLARLRAAEAALSRSLDAFSRAGDLEAALARALPVAAKASPLPTPANRRWPAMLALTAALTALLVSIPERSHPPGDAPIRSLTPAALPEALEGGSVSAPSLQEIPSVSTSPAPRASEEPAPAAPPAPEPLPETATPEVDPPEPPCGLRSLQEIEPRALLGELDRDLAGCLDALVEAGGPERERISMILMADAWARADLAGWEVLAQRHLTEIRGDDADLCYKYALYLVKKGPARAGDVVLWASRALEVASGWQGKTRESRTLSLYKVRAAASQQLWLAAEQAHDTSAAATYRAQTGAYAKEWYLFAKEVGENSKVARELCESAGGGCSP